MSISIDDLVSSLSASHVSQEAMDIATLQVFPPSLSLNLVNFVENSIQSQLSKVIYYPSQGQSGVHCVTRRNSYAQPCNTPTPTSATASFHWEWDDANRYRGQNPPYVAPPPLHDCDVDDEMEDEQTVEDLLNAHTLNQCQFDAPLAQRQQPQKYRPVSSGQPFPMPPPPPPTYDNTPGLSGSPSHFANTDPFYLAASQTASPPSFFTQAARPAPNSPFNLNLSAQQAHHVLEVESRTVLVCAGQSR
jgi:hypothetical protein